MKHFIKRSNCNRCDRANCSIYKKITPTKECRMYNRPSGTFKMAELLLAHPQSTHDTLKAVAPGTLLVKYL